MEAQEVLKQALSLTPELRLLITEGLIQSLDQPDQQLDEVWGLEATKRLQAYREGKLAGVPMEEIF